MWLGKLASVLWFQEGGQSTQVDVFKRFVEKSSVSEGENTLQYWSKNNRF